MGATLVNGVQHPQKGKAWLCKVLVAFLQSSGCTAGAKLHFAFLHLCIQCHHCVEMQDFSQCNGIKKNPCHGTKTGEIV